MSRDILLEWSEGSPSIQDIRRIMANFFGAECVIANRHNQVGEVTFYTVSLPRKPSHPLHGYNDPLAHEFCWIEVWPDVDGSTMITTRSQDAFTNALAEGLAKAFCDYLEARRTSADE